MEAATEHTIQEPSAVLKELQLAMTAPTRGRLEETRESVIQTTSLHGETDQPSIETVEDVREDRLIDTESLEPITEAEAEVRKAVEASKEPVVVRLPGKKPVRIDPGANLAHVPSHVRQWVGTVQPSGLDRPTDMDAGDVFAERESLYEDPPPHEEELPSDAGSVRSELNMFRLYVEGQLGETRKYMEEQMRSTHSLLTKIDTRLAILENRINLPSSRPTSVSLPTRPIPPPTIVTAGDSKVAARTASTSTVTLGGGLTELPLYTPNKVIQVRTLNRHLSSQHVQLQPILKAIPRKDWNLQYINTLPVFKY